jgi:hypothetical protein
MTESGSGRSTLGWAAALALGTWLAVGVSRWMAWKWAEMAGTGPRGRQQPLPEVVHELLEEHRDQDRPMVQAFEEALDGGEIEEKAQV